MRQNLKPRKNNRQKYSKNNHVVKHNVTFGRRSGTKFNTKPAKRGHFALAQHLSHQGRRRKKQAILHAWQHSLHAAHPTHQLTHAAFRKLLHHFLCFFKLFQ